MHTLNVFYRPDDYPHWVPWKTFTQRLEMIGKAGELDFGSKPTARAGFAPRVPLPKPADNTDTNTGRNLRRGYGFQVKFSGSGHLTIKRFRLQAQRIIEKATAVDNSP